MAVRAREILRRDQAELLLQYRLGRAAGHDVAQLPGPAVQGMVVVWGRASQVITADPDYGAHLVVAPQGFTGTPPTAGDSGAASMRCYPAPNHTVTDYSVDEYVKVLPARGAFVADKST